MLPLKTQTTYKQIVLTGLESVGKSSIFRLLSGESTGGESNFRGTTIQARAYRNTKSKQVIYDVPGIRLKSDSQTTLLALEQIQSADTILLVVRASNSKEELKRLFELLKRELAGKKIALIFTFKDKINKNALSELEALQDKLRIPVVTINSREMSGAQFLAIHNAIQNADYLNTTYVWEDLIKIEPVQPKKLIFEHNYLGPFLSIGLIFTIFGLPIYLAYIVANNMQPLMDVVLIDPLKLLLDSSLANVPLLHAVIIGDYGLLTLGWYSFLWAFPVVVFISISVAITEESGLKDRITASLDPLMRFVGLSGRDLIPVLTGFGCNVVAVLQTRSCSACTRKACVSMIAIGSACSYQIGASLSIFNTSGHSWLFAPYIFSMFCIGALHNRVWGNRLTSVESHSVLDRAFMQKPTFRATWWRVKTVLEQFVYQAIPIFLLICVVGAVLEYSGVMGTLTHGFSPVLKIFSLPEEASPGIIFSMIRKDGLLVLNQGEGVLLSQLSSGQVFLLVYLGSTLSACLVTLWTIGKEMGTRYTLKLVGRQLITVVLSTYILSLFISAV